MQTTSAFSAAFTAFRKEFMSADLPTGAEFSDAQSRASRWKILWAMYENTGYSDVHSWAQSYRGENALYRYTRNLYNPAYALGEFWATHLMGGTLDPAAGNSPDTALPIEISEENAANDAALRQAIAMIWKWSAWSAKRRLYTLYGPVMGDVGLQVVDDTARGRVYLRVVPPGIVKAVDRDYFGNVKGYSFEYPRFDGRTWATYTETASRPGDGSPDVVYETFRDGKPWAWADNPTGENGVGLVSWAEPYGFVPLVMVQNIDVGLDWGWSEFQSQLSRIREVDELASLLSDQTRKSVNAIPFVSGVAKNRDGLTFTRSDPTTKKPQLGREESDMLTASDPQARVQWMVAPLDYPGVMSHITGILDRLESEYPELRYDRLRVSGGASGEALRIARQPAESKVVSRRAAYDDGLVRAQQMAIAIAGARGYAGFEGFDLGSYERGALDHSVGNRPVFGTDVFETLAQDEKFWTIAKTAVGTGYPLDLYLRDQGWDEERIMALTSNPEYAARIALLRSGTMDQQGDGGQSMDDDREDNDEDNMIDEEGRSEPATA